MFGKNYTDARFERFNEAVKEALTEERRHFDVMLDLEKQARKDSEARLSKLIEDIVRIHHIEVDYLTQEIKRLDKEIEDLKKQL